MITDKSIEYTLRVDRLASEEFGEAYTLKTTYWNDGDFRIVVYSTKAVDLPGKQFVELWYQDSKMPNGELIKVKTEQEEEDLPRNEARQTQVGETEPMEIPPLPGNDDAER